MGRNSLRKVQMKWSEITVKTVSVVGANCELNTVNRNLSTVLLVLKSRQVLRNVIVESGTQLTRTAALTERGVRQIITYQSVLE